MIFRRLRCRRLLQIEKRKAGVILIFGYAVGGGNRGKQFTARRDAGEGKWRRVLAATPCPTRLSVGKYLRILRGLFVSYLLGRSMSRLSVANAHICLA